ncbi:MAG: hypothetical protein WC496_02820 [Phycisphaerae bacterium]|jgi:hypothetical protein
MSVNTIQISDALVAALNGGSFGKQFVAKMSVLPPFEIKDLSDLQVTVIPRNVDVSILSRDKNMYDHTIDVAIQKKLDAPIEPEFDSLVAFCFELVSAISQTDLRDINVCYSGVAIDPLYSLDDLAQDGIFTSVLSVKYKTAS